MPTVFESMAMQLARCAAQPHPNACRPNPHKGLLLPGSATYRVYRTLLAVYPTPLQAWELRNRCGSGRGAVAWAVRYLRNIGCIDCLPDDGRHLHYLRYRARVER